MLTPQQRVRHARHLLLAEIGEQGQAVLCAARVRPAAGADPGAASVASNYLERAGVRVVASPDPASFADGATAVSVAEPAAVAALAGQPSLEPAAAALAGAFAAVETIKALVGVGRPATLPPELRLG